jgi:hypothetical protein
LNFKRAVTLHRKNILMLFKSNRGSCYDMMLYLFREFNQMFNYINK